MKWIAVIVLAGLAVAVLPADEPAELDGSLQVAVGADAGYVAGTLGEEITNRGFAPGGFIELSYTSTYLDLVATLAGGMDGKYGAVLVDLGGGSLGNIYMYMKDSGIRVHAGNLYAELGRFSHYDVVDSPYSLFENSGGGLATTMAFRWTDGPFLYESRWLGLNIDSAVTSDVYATGFPDRGANIKVIGYSNGEMRFGFQDAVAYAFRWFDFEYFISPLPMYLTQYMRGTGGVPWATDYDDNCIMGAFWDWNRPGAFYAYAQVLLDDFSLPSFMGGPNNPWQIATSLGGTLETTQGNFGVFVAMATKYTFEPSYASQPYGYSYYPETRYTSYWQNGGLVTRAISIDDNMIGYKYGENNLAVQLDWRHEFRGLELGSALEFRLAGSNSPANPGHDSINVPSTGTEWLNDAVLEKRFLLTIACARQIGDFHVFGSMTGGVALDALELRTATSAPAGNANDLQIYSPVIGNTKFLYQFNIGAVYRLPSL